MGCISYATPSMTPGSHSDLLPYLGTRVSELCPPSELHNCPSSTCTSHALNSTSVYWAPTTGKAQNQMLLWGTETRRLGLTLEGLTV